MGRLSGVAARPALATAVGVGLLAALGAGAPGHAESGGTGPTASTFGAAPASSTASETITLLTGDRVQLQQVEGGRHAVTVDPAPRPDGSVPQFHVTTHGDDTHVVPGDVQSLIPDRLDPALFDVTALAEQGFGDSASQALPLILDYPDDRPSTLRRQPMPGIEQRLQLDSVNAVAVDADRSALAEFGQAVLQLARAEVAGTPSTAATAGPLAGVEKIWLDQRVTAQLDRSTGQIGAPIAWKTGVDGSGVTVAVLDSGIDETHPDLTGKVSAAANFTWEEDASDHYGHGTHVASIVAGSGAASDGDRRGVAPGVRLLSGKVLNNAGEGLTSWVIAGMEWAAAEQDADIVNMSLGMAPGHPEGALVDSVLDELSAEHGTLFVVAAGNAGCAGCVGSPGTAASALTVGAVDRDDRLADFSSRGPTPGATLKPDVTAPGVGIAAARAAGTGSGDDPYIEYSGTSMAAPHVAGAAALLAQARPELTATELKGALMSTAAPTAGLSVFEQGTGRVDVENVLASPVLATPGSLDLGLIPYPDGEATPIERTVTYRNVSGEAVTLRLRADVDGLPAGQPAVTPSELTIAPGETASTSVVFDVAGGTAGQFTGKLIAEVDGGNAIRTPIAVEVEPEYFDLTLRGIARDGRPAPVRFTWGSGVLDVETGETMTRPCEDVGHEVCFAVPAGSYSVLAFISTMPAWADPWEQGATPLNSSLVGDAELAVDGDMIVELDARKAVEVEVETPDHDARANLGGAEGLMWTRWPANGTPTTEYVSNPVGGQLEERLFMQPMDDVTAGALTAASRWRLAEPDLTLDVDGADQVELNPMYYRADWFSDNSWQYPMVTGTSRLPVVDAGDGSAAAIEAVDLEGALALVRRSDDVSVTDAANRAGAAGARLVAVYNDRPGPSDVVGEPPNEVLTVPTVRLTGEEGAALRQLLAADDVTVTATGTPTSPYSYNLVFTERAGIPAELHYAADSDKLVAVDRDVRVQLEGSATEYAWPFEHGVASAVAFGRPVRDVPRVRTDYFVPDSRTAWRHGIATPEQTYNNLFPGPFITPLQLANPLVTYGEPARDHQSWLRQPLTPGFDRSQLPARQGDVLIIPTAGLVDADGNFGEATAVGFDGKGYDAVFQIWHGDELLGEAQAPSLPSGTLTLPPEEETYRFTYDIDNNTPWARMSTQTRTEWTFRSGHTDPEKVTVLPLLTLDYDLDVDLTNQRPTPRERRGPNEVEITVGHQAGADIAVTDIEVDVSYDDGASWQPHKVRRAKDGSYAVHLANRPPRDSSGFLSLRVRARDAAGNGIEQEIIRAAALPEK